MAKQLSINNPAPDFELQDTDFSNLKLSKFRNRSNVVLVLIRGLVCPFARAQLAQLRQDYAAFVERNAEIIVITQDGTHTVKRYWQENDIHFNGVTDYKSKGAEMYHQPVDMFDLGKMPAVFIVDKGGLIRYVHYGESMSDIPGNQDLLIVLDHINLGHRP